MAAPSRSDWRCPAIIRGSRRSRLHGDRLAFERASQVLSVFKLRTRGEPEPVLVSSAWDYNPQFSPDGRRIAFSSRRSGDVEEIWLASADGSGAQQLTHGPGTRQTLPAWSPDGRQIAFESTGANGRADIWVIPADGGVPRQVTTDPGEENAPVWSRDGKRIYFLSDRDGDGSWGGHDTWQVPAEGGPSTRVTAGRQQPRRVRVGSMGRRSSIRAVSSMNPLMGSPIQRSETGHSWPFPLAEGHRVRSCLA